MSAVFARLINPIVWRIPGNGARKLFSFSLAEHGSMLDLCAAANQTTSPERQAAYLRHLLDERRHANMFAARSTELRAKDNLETLGFPNADTEDLFERLGEIRFLAFVHRGEKRGRQQFEAYRDWFGGCGDNKARAFFDGIIRDEQRHESYTFQLLTDLTGGPSGARKELRRAAAWEAWRRWRRLGRFIAEKVYFPLMLVVYGLLAPFALALAVSRPPGKGWVVPQKESDIDRTAIEGSADLRMSE